MMYIMYTCRIAAFHQFSKHWYGLNKVLFKTTTCMLNSEVAGQIWPRGLDFDIYALHQMGFISLNFNCCIFALHPMYLI